METPELDANQRRIYEESAIHIAEAGRHDRTPDFYSREMLTLHQKLLLDYCQGRAVIELGCGSGEYLVDAASTAHSVIGVDFSANALALAQARRSASRLAAHVVQANIRELPFTDASFDVAFSFSTLYAVPNVHDIVGELARILRPGGVALLEMGNYWSLHTVIYRRGALGIRFFHIPVRQMRRILTEAGLSVIRWRAFQLFPLIGGGPPLLKVLTSARWRWLLSRKLRGRMLDEVVSSSWPCRFFAFRHLVVCERTVSR